MSTSKKDVTVPKSNILSTVHTAICDESGRFTRFPMM